MPTPETQARLESCRRAVRSYLYERPAVAQSAVTVHRGLSIEHDFGLEEVAAALSFLAELEQLRKRPDPLGATVYFQISAEGILAHERA